jgi:hypothetical protein
MRHLAFCALIAFSTYANSEVLLVATDKSGASIMLTDEPGPCVDGAKLSYWVSPDATHRIPGCYKIYPQGVAVSWFDGDRGDIPLAALRKPTGL